MGELQWALLIVCAVLVVALYVFSRRGKNAEGEGAEPDAPDQPATQQMDLLTRADPAYDEFGVGRPRPRGLAAQADPGTSRPMTSAPPKPSAASLLRPSSGASAPGLLPAAPGSATRSAPSLQPAAAAPTPAAAAAAAAVAKPAAGPGKLIALLVAPVEETDILGVQLHQALNAQGLKFGAGELYHRMIGGQIVYSVASLIRPGKLVPAEAGTFSTKGLTVILNLPGPVSAAAAFDDMIGTTRALAAALKSEIFDARRERLTDAVVADLRSEVKEWALSSGGPAA